jgi:hypothetical protein
MVKIIYVAGIERELSFGRPGTHASSCLDDLAVKSELFYATIRRPFHLNVAFGVVFPAFTCLINAEQLYCPALGSQSRVMAALNSWGPPALATRALPTAILLMPAANHKFSDN